MLELLSCLVLIRIWYCFTVYFSYIRESIYNECS